MGTYKEIDGNLITLARQGLFDGIVHGCNCFNTMGAGIAPQMAKEFVANEFPMERNILTRGDHNKLGQIDIGTIEVEVLVSNDKITLDDYYFNNSDFYNKDCFAVINAYTQFGFGSNHKDGSMIPLDYVALAMCFKKINHLFKGLTIGFPKIGCGLAGGNWDVVKANMKIYMPDVNIIVENYKQ